MFRPYALSCSTYRAIVHPKDTPLTKIAVQPITATLRSVKGLSVSKIVC